MQSTDIILAALAVILLGAVALYYQYSGSRRFETLISFCGVALVASGLAMFRDGVEGSRSFLWALPSGTAAVSIESGDKDVAGAPAFRTVVARQ
jgi:hypothetical protein